MKKLISIFLSVVMLFTLSVPAFAANNSTSLENATETAIEDLSDASNLAAVSRSAGLAWGPVTIGNVKLYMTNPHLGYVPGLNIRCSHVNLHADNTTTKKPIFNFHIVKYKSGDSDCLYIYDSVSRKVIINQCFKNWTSAAGAVVEAVKTALKSVLDQANLLATVAIWGGLIVALADLLIPMDPIPVLPFSVEEPDPVVAYSASVPLPNAA